MLEERGVVVDSNELYAWVQTERTSSCGTCAVNKGSCGTASLAKILGQKYTEIRVSNHLGAKIGDQVTIGLEEQALLRSSMLLYIVPLMSLFVFAIGYESLAAQAMVPAQEIFTVLAGLGGLAGGFLVVNRFSRNMADDARYEAVLLKVDTAPVVDADILRNF